MTEELKGCPWCGQPATFEPFENCPGWGRMTLRHKDCFSQKETEEFPLPEEMAARWNLRAPDARDARIAELEAELAALKAPAPTPSNPGELEPATPWYPDDSGEWVEVPEDLREMPAELLPETIIVGLINHDRHKRLHTDFAGRAKSWMWAISPGLDGRIVAYKVVKP